MLQVNAVPRADIARVLLGQGIYDMKGREKKKEMPPSRRLLRSRR